MDPAYISAFFGLGGALVGSLASFTTTWMTQHTTIVHARRNAAKLLRETIFVEFIGEASRLYGDALSHEKDDVTDLVILYALLARMRLFMSPVVIASAERVMATIIATYIAPNRSLRELHHLAQHDGLNFLRDFADICRRELEP